jgi:creatinine amidohydrolase
MTFVRLADTAWERVRDLDRAATVAILPTGATEAHGPHLPMDTDVTIAEAMAESGGRRLVERGLSVLLLPALAYTPAEFAAEFPGTVSIRRETASALVRDIAASLDADGFRTLAIANAHFDPGHLAALYSAIDGIRESGGPAVAFPDVTRRPWGSRLTEEFRSGACHAGRYEGSIVLARTPEKVDEDIMKTLPPHPVSLSRAIADGKAGFREAGGDRAYFGAPAEATSAEGAATIDVLGRILEEAVLEIPGLNEVSDESRG